MRLQLVAKVNDPKLLKKSMHEQGTTFYQHDHQGDINRIVYFSTSRIVDYEGKVDETLAKLIRADGHLVESIEIDESRDSITILQSKTS